jgi:hypothetical protein
LFRTIHISSGEAAIEQELFSRYINLGTVTRRAKELLRYSAGLLQRKVEVELTSAYQHYGDRCQQTTPPTRALRNYLAKSDAVISHARVDSNSELL